MDPQLDKIKDDVTDTKVAIAKLTVMQEQQTAEIKSIKMLMTGFMSGIWALVLVVVTVWGTVHFTGHF